MTSLKSVLSSDREMLPEYLLMNGSYKSLKKELVECELKEMKKIFKDKNLSYDTGGCITSRLLSGNVAKRQYRQMAIAELPTHELVYALEKIIDKLGYTKMEEVNAGTGILTTMMNLLTTIKSQAHDSKNYLRTSGNTYCDVKKKHFLEYVTKPIDDDSILVLNHIYPRDTEGIGNILKRIKPKAIIHISAFYEDNHHHKKIMNDIDSAGYDYTCLPIKQISNLDVFSAYPELKTHYSRSQVVVIVRKNNPPINIEENTIEHWKRIIGDDLIGKKSLNNISIKSLLINYWLNGGFSGKLLDLTFEDYEFKCNMSEDRLNEILIMINTIFVPLRKVIEIPYFLYSTKEIYMWYKLIKANSWPLKVTDRNSLKEFYKLYNDCTIKWKILKENNVIPSWVNNATDAKKCIIGMYSHDDHRWMVKQIQMPRRNVYSYGGMTSLPLF